MKIEKRQFKILSATLGLALFLFALPFIADGAIPDFLNQAINKIMGLLGPILSAYIFSFFTLAIGAAGVFISTSLLQWIIDISPEALTVLSGDAAQIVQVGWNFSVGITNMLLVIAFIFVAVATIMGFEKYHLQKLLPRLVVVAFLVNFTLLFVGMAIDISNFLFNSISLRFSADGGNILWSVIEPLFDLSDRLIKGAFATISIYALMSIIPGYAVAKAVANLIAFPFVLPLIIQQAFIGIILISLSIFFFIFFLIFVMRIFIVQILAIISPLAFFCWVFPDDTKKYWSLWLTTILQWLFVGVVFIFLMYIGLGLAPLVMNMGDPLVEETPFYLRWFTREFIPYLLLLAYFVVIILLLKKAVPALANATISSVTSIATKISPYAKAFASGSQKFSDQVKTESPTIRSFGQWASSQGDPFRLRPLGSAIRGAGKWATRDPAKRENNAVREEMKTLENTSVQEKVAHFRDNSSYSSKLSALFAAQDAGQGDEFRRNLGNDFDRVRNPLAEKAATLDMRPNFERAVPIDHLLHHVDTTPGATLSGINHNSTVVQNLLVRRLGDGENMEKAAPQILAGIRSSNRDIRHMATQLFNAIIQNNNTSYLKALARGAGGRQGLHQIRTEILNRGGLSAVNPNALDEINRTPGWGGILSEFN